MEGVFYIESEDDFVNFRDNYTGKSKVVVFDIDMDFSNFDAKTLMETKMLMFGSKCTNRTMVVVKFFIADVIVCNFEIDSLNFLSNIKDVDVILRFSDYKKFAKDERYKLHSDKCIRALPENYFNQYVENLIDRETNNAKIAA